MTPDTAKRIALTDAEIRELAKSATDFMKMLDLCRDAFTPRLYHPLKDTQVNDVPVIAAIVASAVREAALLEAARMPTREQMARIVYYEHCGGEVEDGDFERGIFQPDIDEAYRTADAILAAWSKPQEAP